jgi:hypothetical protein
MSQKVIGNQMTVVGDPNRFGEAAKRVSDRIRDLTPAIPWRPIAGLRDVVIHDYFGVDLDIVCDVTFTKVPTLREELTRLLARLDAPSRCKDSWRPALSAFSPIAPPSRCWVLSRLYGASQGNLKPRRTSLAVTKRHYSSRSDPAGFQQNRSTRPFAP